MTRWRVLALVLGLFVLASVVVAFVSTAGSENRNLTTVIADAQAGRIASIRVSGDDLTVRLADGHSYHARKERGTSVVTLLASAGIDASTISIEVGRDPSPRWISVMVQALSIVLMVSLVVWISRSAWRRFRS